MICHGIPDSRVLQAGDILSIDVSVYLNGYHGDNCKTILVGEDDELTSDDDIRAKKLIHTNKNALDLAIQECYPGNCLSKIGAVIEKVMV